MLSEITKVIVTASPPSKPNAPPLNQTADSDNSVERTDGPNAFPLTRIPNMFPWKKFHAECKAPIPQMFPRFQR